MTDADLGTYIATLRQRSNVSQLALCQRIGKSRKWLMRCEKGQVSLSVSELYIIAQVLKTPIDSFSP